MQQQQPESNESKYGFFCDMEEDPTFSPKYFVFQKRDSFEIHKTTSHKQPIPINAVIHPVYDHSSSYCIYVKDEDMQENKPNTKKSSAICAIKNKIKSKYSKYKNRAKQYFYSSVVCSLFIISVYISIIMPIEQNI